MEDLFKLISDMVNPNPVLKTNKGDMTSMQIVNYLTYISYATQRDLGMTHEQCMRIGLGNEAMAALYEKEQPNSSLE
jgi:hypothetical protein